MAAETRAQQAHCDLQCSALHFLDTGFCQSCWLHLHGGRPLAGEVPVLPDLWSGNKFLGLATFNLSGIPCKVWTYRARGSHEEVGTFMGCHQDTPGGLPEEGPAPQCLMGAGFACNLFWVTKHKDFLYYLPQMRALLMASQPSSTMRVLPCTPVPVCVTVLFWTRTCPSHHL